MYLLLLSGTGVGGVGCCCWFLWGLFFFFETISLYSPGWPGTATLSWILSLKKILRYFCFSQKSCVGCVCVRAHTCGHRTAFYSQCSPLLYVVLNSDYQACVPSAFTLCVISGALFIAILMNKVSAHQTKAEPQSRNYIRLRPHERLVLCKLSTCHFANS